jgi:hypothetical protein
MTKINECCIEVEFEFGSVNNKLMQVQLINDQNVVPVNPQHVDNKYQAAAKINVKFPTTVKLEFAGKDPNIDTILDDKGNIVEDLYVKITAIKLDGFALRETFLNQRLTIHTLDNQCWTTNYIGFNGTITINFEKSNTFSQYLYFFNN